MSACELRPHHALCLGFFRGEGYSPSFTANLSALLARLEAEDPAVTLKRAADAVCRACPHNRGGVCDSAGKVARYDAAVLVLTGLAEGDRLPWTALRALVRERILEPGRLGEVCGDCQWRALCHGAR